MLWMSAVVLTSLWLLGMASAHTMGGLLHTLLVLASIAVLVRVFRDQRLA